MRTYYEIVRGSLVPRFILASRVEAEEVSRRAHREASKAFLDLLEETGLKKEKVLSLERPKLSYLDVKYELAKSLASRCELCERRCRVDRKHRLGVCRVPYEPVVASAFLHPGEERPLVPSGTIFFYGCNFRCVFCQNYDISRGRKEHPKPISVEDLAALADFLGYRAKNINRVGGEPTVYMHAILGAMRLMKSMKPQIRNSNMYLTEAALELILDVIDLRLPDFKYGNDKCALRYSAALRYREIVTRNIKRAYSTGADGIIRHLVLPGHVECCTKKVLERISENASERFVNVMDQYYPAFLARKYPEINRRITVKEYEEAIKYARSLGLKLIE